MENLNSCLTKTSSSCGKKLVTSLADALLVRHAPFLPSDLESRWGGKITWQAKKGVGKERLRDEPKGRWEGKIAWRAKRALRRKDCLTCQKGVVKERLRDEPKERLKERGEGFDAWISRLTHCESQKISVSSPWDLPIKEQQYSTFSNISWRDRVWNCATPTLRVTQLYIAATTVF